MVQKVYEKKCDVGRLESELIAVGLPKQPTAGYKFYCSSCEQNQDDFWYTTVFVIDGLSQSDSDKIDSVIAAHVPIPLPEESEFVKTDDGKLYVRAETRPLNCTTVFCCAGDALAIGDGKELVWDFSNSDDIVTLGVPAGYKRKRLVFSFRDTVNVKEGKLYFFNASKGSYVDMHIVCPSGGYYYSNSNQPRMAAIDTSIAHYVIKQFIQSTVAGGDDFKTEGCSAGIPAYYKFWLDITVPVADVTSNGFAVLTIYRTRTVILP